MEQFLQKVVPETAIFVMVRMWSTVSSSPENLVGREKLQDAIIKETLNPLILNMCASAKIKPVQVYRLAIGANTTMNHLLMGVDADPVRMEPYIPTFFKTNSLFASDIGLKVNPDTVSFTSLIEARINLVLSKP